MRRSAASQAKKRNRDLDVVMFERGRATSYSACGIPYWISGAVEHEASLIARTPDQHRAAGIDVRLRTEVVGIDLDRRSVSWRDLESGSEGTEPFQVAAAGGHVDLLPKVPGYLEVEIDKLQARLVRRPKRVEVPVTCEVQLVVEYYAAR